MSILQFQASPARATTAVILAAGTGSRLRPLTLTAPKCLTEVAGDTLLGRQIAALETYGFERLVLATGYLGDQVMQHALERSRQMEVVRAHNPLYRSTNNMYSLWCAASFLRDNFVLLESDLVFQPAALSQMMFADRIAVDRFDATMNGTTVTLNPDGTLAGMQVGRARKPSGELYKTVNIYSLSSDTWTLFRAELEFRLDRGLTNEYYEAALAELIRSGAINLEPVHFGRYLWDEIDSVDDLERAERRLTADSRRRRTTRDQEMAA